MIEHTFLEIPGRPFVTLDLGELDSEVGTPDIVYHVEHQRLHKIDDAVVRVRYTATPEQARRVDHQAITQALLAAGAHKVYKIEPTILRADRGRLDDVLQHLAQESDQEYSTPASPADAGSLTPLQAVEAWIISQGLDEETASALRARTTAYLQGHTPTAAAPQEATAA